MVEVEQVAPLAALYKPGWEPYQQALILTITALSPEQLALPLGPQQRSIGELLDHMVGARFNWFHLWMGEGDPNLDWNDDEEQEANDGNNQEPTVYTAASLVTMFEKSWRVISCPGPLDVRRPGAVVRASSLPSGVATESRVRRSASTHSTVDCLARHGA